MVDHGEFGKRFHSDEGTKRNRKKRLPNKPNNITSKIFHLPQTYANVNETEEEESDENENNAQNVNYRGRRVKVMSLSQLSQLINKQIFSDDFDRSSFNTEISKRQKQRACGT